MLSFKNLTNFHLGWFVTGLVLVLIIISSLVFSILTYLKPVPVSVTVPVPVPVPPVSQTKQRTINLIQAASSEPVNISETTTVDGYLLKEADIVLLKSQLDGTSGFYMFKNNHLQEFEFETTDVVFAFCTKGKVNSNKIFVVEADRSVTKNKVPIHVTEIGALPTNFTGFEIEEGSVPIMGKNKQWNSVPFYLVNLKDTSITDLQPNQVLLYKGSSWKNEKQLPDISQLDTTKINANSVEFDQTLVYGDLVIVEPTTESRFFVLSFDSDNTFTLTLPKITAANEGTCYYFIKTSVLGQADIVPTQGDLIVGGVELRLVFKNDYVSIRCNFEMSTWLFE